MNRKYSKEEKMQKGEGLSPQTLAEQKKKNKRAAKITLITIGIVGILTIALSLLPYDAILDAMFPKEKPENGGGEVINFSPADYETDILRDSSYTSLSRYLSVKMGNETVFLFNDEDAEKYGELPAFLWRYVQSLIKGDVEGYNALFTESYLKENGRQGRFPMQRLYNISATCYSSHTFTEEELEGAYKGVTQYRVEMLYSIQKNDGTVRKDMGSDVSKPIYLEILVSQQDSAACINSISYGR